MSHSKPDQTPAEPALPPDGESRRGLMCGVASFGMWLGLAGSYGAFAVSAVKFLFPDRSKDKGWVFVTDVAGLGLGQSMEFRTPTGATAAVTHLHDKGDADDFLALSNTCPHLGCQVHWEPHNTRFFCPCHNGVFTPDGVATEGPPADAGQSLEKYPLKVEMGRLFMLVPLKRLPGGRG